MDASPSNWLLAEVRSSDRGRGIFLYLEAKPKNWRSRPLSEEISISRKYEGEFPDSFTKASMDEMEEALLPLKFGENSFLTLVMTVGGLRELVFYADDYEKFARILNECLAKKPRYPIAIEHSHDPEWKYWHSFVDKLEGKKEPNQAPEPTAPSGRGSS